MYKNLTGEFGLATDDPAFAALAQPGKCGAQLLTNGVASAFGASSEAFPNAEGYHAPVKYGGEDSYELQDSDAVCFQSAPADAYVTTRSSRTMKWAGTPCRRSRR